ncbi:MAG: uridine kinase [Blautia sp.]|nr:uridine kinase [Blautia sp.]
MYIIGLCGGSSSGKSTAVDFIQKKNGDQVALVAFDSYYISRPDLVFEERRMINVDEPAAIDKEEIIRNINLLREGKTIQQPIYSFETFLREAQTIETAPAPILLVDGIFSFYFEEIRELFDLKVFIDADVDVRLSRRILRDMNVRHRPLEYIIDQYFQKVKPMHEIYVEPYKKYADIIIPHNRNNDQDFRILGSIIDNVLKDL